MIYLVNKAFRLCRLQKLSHRKLTKISTSGHDSTYKFAKTSSRSKDFVKLLQNFKDKITFNSFLEHEKLELGHLKYFIKSVKEAKKIERQKHESKKVVALPVALQYYVDKDRLLTEQNEENVNEPEGKFHLPFEKQTAFSRDSELNPVQKKLETLSKSANSEFKSLHVGKWMTSYEHFDDKLLEEAESEDSDNEWGKFYGRVDPTAPISKVPCGGCGALLHCSDSAIPGYLPSEIFSGRTEEELKTIECQRCHFLKEYNIALDVSVEPVEYENLLQSIRYTKALVVVMVDLLDYPCSIWPGIMDIVGSDRPVIIVGNKVDLIPGDSIGYLNRIKESLITELNKTTLKDAKIRHVSLISAKTGYGVEELINAMFKQWLYKGDVYLVGCTNVGKSSLFNALIQSDYCKVQAVDIIKRATISRWPGTTLQLLKFPITRPTGWKLSLRSKRLKSEANILKLEQDIRRAQTVNLPNVETPSLMSHIGRTFSNLEDDDDAAIAEKKYKMLTLNEKADVFKNSHWFFDTPGVLHPDQVLSLLSTEELLLTIPKTLISPQTYYLSKGSSIFIGGLARIDFIDCDYPCRFTIFCSECLPITVTKTEDADEVYNTFLGTELFAVPRGSEKRMSNWPGLKPSEKDLVFKGEGPKRCCGDVVLSSVGWVGVTAKGGTECRVQAWTPDARGVHQRYPSILPSAINLKGKRIRDTPAYMRGTVFKSDK